MSDKGEVDRLEGALETVDKDKRDSMRTMVLTAAFIVPVVASFAIDGLTVSPALAASNSS
jgi:hypothetical protein